MQAKNEAEGMKEAEPSAVIEGEGQNLHAECGKVGWWIVEQEEERPGERILLPHKGGNTFHMQKEKKKPHKPECDVARIWASLPSILWTVGRG